MHSLHSIDGICTAAYSDFLSLSETRSFQRTAEKQHLSQPALSRRIQSLEKAVGAKLINRATHPISLTKAGETLLPYIREAVGRLEEGLDTFRSVVSSIDDPVRIVATHTAAVSTLPLLLKSSDVSLSEDQIVVNSFRTDRCLTEVREGRADFGLCLWPNSIEIPNDLEAKVIRQDSLIPVAAKDYTPKPHYNLLSYTPGGLMDKTMREAITQLQSKTNLAIVFESPAIEVLLAMVRAGFGVSYIPSHLITAELKAKQLRKLSWRAIPVNVLVVKNSQNSAKKINELWSRFGKL